MTAKAGASPVEDAAAFLGELRERGIFLRADGDDLELSFGDARPTTALLEEIRSRKADILGLLGRVSPLDSGNLHHDAAERHEPFPLTRNQQAYWLGRDDAVDGGGVAIHLYFEIDGASIRLDRLEAAWNRVIARHDMLRAIVLPDGSQRVLEQVPQYRFDRADCGDADFETRAARWREEMSHRRADPMVWPSFQFRWLDGGSRRRLFISMDCWAIDGWSYQLLFSEWVRFYEHKDPSIPLAVIAFRDYVVSESARSDRVKRRRDEGYWQRRVEALPGIAELPLAKRRDGKLGRFTRREIRLDPRAWRSFVEHARAHRLTLAMALMTAFAEILRRWSGTADFCLSLPRFNRRPLHPDIERIVGEFATFSIVDSRRDDGADFAARGAAMQARLWRDLDHDELTGPEILRLWRETGDKGGAALVPHVFTNAPEQYLDGEKISFLTSLERLGDIRMALSQTPQVHIDCQYHEMNGGLYLFWDSAEEMFEPGCVAAMFDAYADLVRRLCDDPTTWRAADPTRLPSEQTALIRDCLTGPEVPPSDRSIARRAFLALAEDGRKPALADHRGLLSRQALGRHAVALAGWLRDRDIGPGDCVAVALPKGRGQMIAALAVAFVGAAIAPLDRDAPAARTRQLIALSGARAALLDDSLIAALEQSDSALPALAGSALVALGAEPGTEFGADPAGFVPHDAAPDALRQIIFTSGSTGTPKGVRVTEAGLRNALDHTLREFGIGQDDRVLSLTPFYHDMAWFDLYGMALAGGTLVMPEHARRKDPGHWLELIERHGVTLWNSVPAFMVMLLDHVSATGKAERLRSLRLAFLGGDWIPTDVPERLAGIGATAEVVSVGGPTETTLWNIMFRVPPGRSWQPSIPYGTPIANTRYHILDSDLRPCPLWVAGQLMCSGVGVTPGYLDDDALTDPLHVRHPQSGETLFPSGDFGRLRPEGHIEFLGRSDHRVMINGVRLELGEVESVLGAHPAVDSAVAVPAVVEGDEKTGRKSLLVHVVSKDGPPDESELLAWCRERLPAQIVPARILPLDTLPLTGNGKIDRASLARRVPAPKAARPGAPLDEAEAAMADHWAAVLKRPAEGLAPDSHFFAEGGDSILLIRLFHRVWPDGAAPCSIADLFGKASLRQHAGHLRRDKVQDALPPLLASHRERVPAAAAPRRICFMQRIEPENPFYNLPFTLELTGPLDAERLDLALRRLIARHPIVSSRFVEGDSGPMIERAAVAPPPMRRTDLTALDDREAERTAERIAAGEATTAFDLAAGQLLRAHLLRLAPRRSLLLLTLHHAIFDGLSSDILLRDLLALYDGERLPPPSLDYSDYCVWEQNPVWAARVDSHLAWWKQRLSGAEPTSLPEDRPRPPRQTYRAGKLEFDLPKPAVAALTEVASTAGTSLFTTMLSAFVALIGRACQSDDVVLATHVAGRPLPESEEIVGMFVNTVVLRTGLRDVATVGQLLERTAEAWRDTLAHADAPFEKVVEALAPPRDLSRSPLAQIGFYFENAGSGIQTGRDLTIAQRPAVRPGAHLDLDLTVLTQGDRLRCTFVYAADLLDPESVELLAARFRHMLSRLDHPSLPMSEFCGDSAEDSAVRARFHAPAEKRPLTEGHALQAVLAGLERRGTAVAVTDRTQSWSGEGFRQEVDSLAAWLWHAVGVRPGDRVALWMDRGGRAVAALLAVWRCGAAWVPVDPALPRARAKAILDEAAVAAILVNGTVPDEDSSLQDGLTRESLAGLAIHSLPDRPRTGEAPPLSDVVGDAYWMPTSGSTGTPKLVRGTHRGIVNRRRWMEENHPPAADEAAIHKTALSFADSVQEIVGPLADGVPLHVAGKATVTDPARLLSFLAKRSITRLTAVPSLLKVLLEHGGDRLGERLPALRLIVSSGESLAPETASRLLSALPGVTLLNIYGSSEVAADVTVNRVTETTNRQGLVGRPIANTRIHLLDAKRRPVPIGAVGEIAVTGAGLANGYGGSAPSERFVRLDLDGIEGERAARAFLTGDYGRITHGGELILLGRRDDIVKISGQRLSLDEVRTALARLPGVADACALFDDSSEGGRVLAAVLATAEGCAAAPELRGEELRGELCRLLPAASVPVAIAVVTEFPRVVSGKIDRGALLQQIRQERIKAVTATAEAPRPGTEANLAKLWESLLALPITDRESHFFDLGGNSLSVMRLVSRLKETFGYACPAATVFERPRLRDLARALDTLSAATSTDAIAAKGDDWIEDEL